MKCLLGIDVGTSSTKSAIIDESGKLLGLAQREYPIDTPKPGYAEQRPNTWHQATIETVKETLGRTSAAENISAIGLSGQMHGTVFLGKDTRLLRPSIIWADQRSAAQCRDVYEKLGKKKLGRLTANPIATGFMGATLLWVKENEPEIFRNIYKALLPKDYVRLKLTGKIGAEVTDASSTLLFDTARRCWSDDLLDVLNLPREMLPETHESQEIAGGLTREAADACGLKEGTPVVFGGGDQSMQAIGNGVVTPGLLSSTIGTGGQLFITTETPKYDPQLRTHTFCHALPERWHIMGAMLSAGLSLKWFRDNIASIGPGTSYDQLAQGAKEVAAGSEGLIFLPYLVGERTPHFDPYAKGVFFGMTLRHTWKHFVRAIMEGVAFGLKDSMNILNELRIEINQVIASGGGARSRLWKQIQADVFNKPIITVETREQAASGAAILAGVGIGVYPSVEEACERVVKFSDETIEPNEEGVKRLAANYQTYREIYPALRPYYAKA